MSIQCIFIKTDFREKISISFNDPAAASSILVHFAFHFGIPLVSWDLLELPLESYQLSVIITVSLDIYRVAAWVGLGSYICIPFGVFHLLLGRDRGTRPSSIMQVLNSCNILHPDVCSQ